MLEQSSNKKAAVVVEEEDIEPMDTSEPIDLLEDTYEIETDQNNNIVMIKCKSKDKESTDKQELTKNNVQCKIATNLNKNLNNLTNNQHNNQSPSKTKPGLKRDDQPNETTKANQALNVSAENKKNEIKLNGKEQRQMKKEEKTAIKLTIKPNSTSLQPSSSNQNTTTTTTTIASTNNSSNTTQITNNNSSSNNKTNVISKLRKIAQDSVHNAIKFKKLDEQTAITTIANGLKNEKKVLKCANNNNETQSNNEQVKIKSIHLVDQLTNTKARNEELSSSPNENDQTLAQTPPQLQSQTKKSTNPNNGKLKIPWDAKVYFFIFL